MKREFLIDRQGKTFVLYAGLLDAAHDAGLAGIMTNVLQIPDATNGHMAIVKATVTLRAGDQLRTFDGIGDASPDNVSRMILPHMLRMAETRAKARALRDAVNVGVTALEELSEADQADAPRPDVDDDDMADAAAAYAAQRAQAPAQSPTPPVRSIIASPNQVRAIYAIGRDRLNRDQASMDELSTSMYGATPPELSRQQASALIEGMQNGELH